MPDLTAKRTLVKSPPELWEELSEVEGLAKHLGAFGEIKITKLEPEHTVAWEGEHASGTVSIEPSGWGTKVTLHAELPEEEASEAADEPPAEEPEPSAAEPPAADEPVAEEPGDEGSDPIDAPVAEQIEDEGGLTPAAEEPIAEDPTAEEPQPAQKRRGFWGWLFRTRTAAPAIEPEPIAVKPESEPEAAEPGDEGSDPIDTPVAEQIEDRGGLTPAIEAEPTEPGDDGSDAIDASVAEQSEDEGVLTPADEDPAAEDPADEDPAAEDPADDDSALDPERARAILDEALDALGAAHHRPFSRG
jgi:hypothetical protein